MFGTQLPAEPFRAIVGNLAWTHDGVVWALWRIDPINYQYASPEDKHSFARSIGSMLRALPGEPLILGISSPVDALDTVKRAMHGLDPQKHPLYLDIADAYLRELSRYDNRERSYWVALPLPDASRADTAKQMLASATTGIARSFGLTPPPPSPAEIRARALQAKKINRAAHGLRPATPDEILWIHRRAARRGTRTETTLARVAGGRRAEMSWHDGQARMPSFASLGEVHLDEGGRVEAPKREQDQAAADQLHAEDEAGKDERAGFFTKMARSAWSWLSGPTNTKRTSPFDHRYVKITTPDGGVSYQAFLVFSDLPAAWLFPGAEWMRNLEESAPFPIDWAIRARVMPGRDAKIKIGRKRRQLNDQVGEFSLGENEDADLADTDLPSWVFTAHQQLAHEQAALDANTAEVEYQATIILGVWGQTLDECEGRAEALRAVFSDELTAVRPTGGQIACYAAMLPGVPRPNVADDYTQFLLAEDLAKTMPFSGGHLGDGSGPLIGVATDGGSPCPIHLHLSAWTKRDISASLGLFAELGAGKSVTLKKLLADVGATGGRTIGWDRTRPREQVTFMRAVFGERAVQVAELGDSVGFSLDPLRVLPGASGEQAAETFLTLLLQIEATSERGTVLAEAIEQAAKRPDRSMGALISVLETRGERDPVANGLGRQIRAAAKRKGVEVVFDTTLPPLDLSAPHIVFATHGMSMPKRHELVSEHQLSRLPFAALFGRAVLNLTAVVAKAIAFNDPRFVLVHADECYWLTREGEGSPGYDTVLELIRDGRKNNAGILLAGHDPEDTGDETLLGLLSAMFIGRQRNSALAAKSVNALGVTNPEMAAGLSKVVSTDLSPMNYTDPTTGDPMIQPGREGEFLCKIHGRLGRMKVIIPPVPGLVDAIRTTPGEQASPLGMGSAGELAAHAAGSTDQPAVIAPAAFMPAAISAR